MGLFLASAMTFSACGEDVLAVDGPSNPSSSSPPVLNQRRLPPSRPAAEPPGGFLKKMARHGYLLEPATKQPGEVEPESSIESAREKYGLFTDEDPVSATLYRLTTPNEGPLANPQDPNSPVAIPKYQDTPVWVVYARADMLKDDHDPSLGMVTGTVVVFVDAMSGEAREAITY